jgi:hypothetical protein
MPKLERGDRFEHLGSLLTSDRKARKKIKKRLTISLKKNATSGKTYGMESDTINIFPLTTYVCELWIIEKVAETSINAS